MNSTPLLYLITLWSLVVGYQVNERETPINTPKIQLRPGDLLKSLDKLTADAEVIYSPIQETSTKSADRRAYDDVYPSDNADPESDYDYDKAYEDFVSKYFAQGEKDLNDNDDEDGKDIDSSVDDASPYESKKSVDKVKDEKPKKRSSKSKKCERIRENGQSCVICKDPKTNEKSKSCSYSSEPKPKSYAFSSERSNSNSKDDDENDDDDDNSDESAEEAYVESKAASRNQRIQPRRTSIKELIPPAAAPNSDELWNCTRRKENGRICYYCADRAGEKRECMADKSNPKKRRLDESSKKDSKTKKVFKRMVTYSYKSDAEPKIKEKTYAAYTDY